MGQHHLHAEPGHQADDPLGHGERLPVGGRVGPAHGDLLALESLRPAEMPEEVHGVGHGLGGVVDVALEVHQRGALLQDAGGVALLHRAGDFPHVGVALADVHVVADADHLGHEGDHVGRLPHRLAVGDLALALVQILERQAEEVAGAGEAEAGAGGVVAEDADGQAAVEDPGRDVVSPHLPQDVGHGEDRRQLVVGLLPGEQEVRQVQAVALQSRQLLDGFADCSSVHSLWVPFIPPGQASVSLHEEMPFPDVVTPAEAGVQKPVGNLDSGACPGLRSGVHRNDGRGPAGWRSLAQSSARPQLLTRPTRWLKSVMSSSMRSARAKVPSQYVAWSCHCARSSATSRPCCSTQVKYLRLWMAFFS